MSSNEHRKKLLFYLFLISRTCISGCSLNFLKTGHLTDYIQVQRRCMAEDISVLISWHKFSCRVKQPWLHNIFLTNPQSPKCFKSPLANMTRATCQNMRKLCSGVLSRKQMLQVAPALQFFPGTIPSCAWCVKSAAFHRRFKFSAYRVLRLDQYIPFGHWALIRWMQRISSHKTGVVF